MAYVLITDDSLVQRKIISKIVTEQGHEIQTVASGRSAMGSIALRAPDCLLLDLLMPEMTGQEVLKALKDQQVDFPIVVVTADIQETVRVECMKLGALYFLNKPVKPEELQTILHVILWKSNDGAACR